MIEFLNLKLINQRFDNEFKNQFDNFLSSGRYILGEQLEFFEQEFSNYCGTKYAIGLSNGLDALRLILEGYKILGKLNVGDEIIVPANTFIATILAVSNSGLKPVLVEPDDTTYNIDPSKVEKAITAQTRAILGVHLYGQLYDVKQLETIAINNNLLLIEDAAQAHGAVFTDGRRAGKVSNAAAFSFYPTKNLGALGDAGAITTNDNKLADVIFKLRNYGKVSTYKNDLKGYNCRLDELQAAFLRIKLKYLDADNEKRRGVASFYIGNIDSSKIILPLCEDFNQHVFHLFVIRSKKREELKKYLYKNGVETLVHYPIPIHKQEAYSEFSNLKLPISEKLSETILSLPLNSSLTKDNMLQIVSLINKF